MLVLGAQAGLYPEPLAVLHRRSDLQRRPLSLIAAFETRTLFHKSPRSLYLCSHNQESQILRNESSMHSGLTGSPSNYAVTRLACSNDGL